MCYALYIGSDILFEISKWDPQNRKFYIGKLQDKDKDVIQHFSKSHIYYAGSWRGCGCGFFVEPGWAESENHAEEIEWNKNCIRDFIEFLKKVLQKTDEIELFVCWEGDQSKEPKRKLEVTPGDLLGQSLPFEERDFVIIR